MNDKIQFQRFSGEEDLSTYSQLAYFSDIFVLFSLAMFWSYRTSDEITWTCAIDRLRLRRTDFIFQPPIKGTIEHFSSAFCDPYPIHTPSCNKLSW